MSENPTQIIRHWQQGPLNLLLREITPELCLWDGGFDGAFWNFKVLVETFYGRRGEEKHAALRNKASLSQLSSLDCLHQWWSGQLRRPEKTAQLQDVLENACHIAEGWPIEHEPFNVGEMYGQKIVTPGDPGCTESTYAGRLFDLYLHEFYFPIAVVNDEFISELESRRSDCHRLVTRHRLAHAAFPDLVNNRMRPPRFPPSSGVGEPNLFGATNFPCPWLKSSLRLAWDDESTRREAYPYYLWDLKAKKTVETKTLSPLPDYWVINHTWGRWRKVVNGNRTAIHLDGVPWPVPENSLYDVSALPTKLGGLTDAWPHMGYAWIDLFCIPQDGAPSRFKDLTKAEISRQSTIFRMAKIAVLWWNEIEDWRPLEDAICWLLLEYLGRQTDVMRQKGDESDHLSFLNSPASRWITRIQHLGRGLSLHRTGSLADLIVPTTESEPVIRELRSLPEHENSRTRSPELEEFKLGWQVAMEKIESTQDTDTAKDMKEKLRKRLNRHQIYQTMPSHLRDVLSDNSIQDLLTVDDMSTVLDEPLSDILASIGVERSFTGLGTLTSLGPGMEIEANWGNHNYLATVKPAGWLSSLWTLQEACLRPGMRLLNRHFEPLVIGSCGQEVSLDAICALVDGLNGEIFKLQNDDRFVPAALDANLIQIMVQSPALHMPPGVIEVVASLAATGMNQLLDVSALDLLELGSRRWCSRSRGEAIMSAVGVTEWYLNDEADHSHQKDELVLGNYPFQFVESVRNEFGALFFASRRDRIRFILFVPRGNVLSFRGTMMPFYWGASTLRWRPQDLLDHPATKTWHIQQNGAVVIEEACILLSTSVEKTSVIAANIFMEPVIIKKLRPTRLETQDMYDLMKTVVDDNSFWGALHAVVLMYSTTRIEGIFIMRSCGRYGKVGNFEIRDQPAVEVPAAERVMWTVS